MSKAMLASFARRSLRGLVRRVSTAYRRASAFASPETARRLEVARAREERWLREFWALAGRTLPADLSALERSWDEYTRRHFDPARSDTFYRGWQGDAGYINLVANVRDQLRRVELLRAYERWLPSRITRAVDVGCGTATLTLLLADSVDDLVLVDVDNVARRYVHYKTGQLALGGKARQLEPDQLTQVEAASADVVLCIDVLEHLPSPSLLFREELDRVLRRGGLLFLQAPWGGGVPEHLPEAPLEWVRGGGKARLAEQYERLGAISPLIELKPGCVSGVYRKR
jgi:2-polyprenyl-3-methyl-5-hydroxy-6-metoxy-1,4-benzoquinol methylase